MIEKLRPRLKNATDKQLEQIALVEEKYNITPNVRNFDAHGFRFLDERKRVVRVLDGEWREKTIYVPAPHSDISVIFSNGMLSGWIESKKLREAAGLHMVDTKSLNAMPDHFDFSRVCEHLSVHGGWYAGDKWTCFGCTVELIFNDAK